MQMRFNRKAFSSKFKRNRRNFNLAKEYSIKVGVGFCERFNPAVLALKKSLKMKKLSALTYKDFHPTHKESAM